MLIHIFATFKILLTKSILDQIARTKRQIEKKDQKIKE